MEPNARRARQGNKAGHTLIACWFWTITWCPRVSASSTGVRLDLRRRVAQEGGEQGGKGVCMKDSQPADLPPKHRRPPRPLPTITPHSPIAVGQSTAQQPPLPLPKPASPPFAALSPLVP